jgi:hypothetical protein
MLAPIMLPRGQGWVTRGDRQCLLAVSAGNTRQNTVLPAYSTTALVSCEGSQHTSVDVGQEGQLP